MQRQSIEKLNFLSAVKVYRWRLKFADYFTKNTTISSISFKIIRKIQPSWVYKPSQMSKLSSSTFCFKRSGKYQPGGGAGRRTRVRRSSISFRLRMLPMVRLVGTSRSPRSEHDLQQRRETYDHTLLRTLVVSTSRRHS